MAANDRAAAEFLACPPCREDGPYQCFVPGCPRVTASPFGTHGQLGSHLYKAHNFTVRPIDLASNGFTRCPAQGCTQPIQSLLYKSSNAQGRSSYFDHLHRLKTGPGAEAHRQVIQGKGGAVRAADSARAEALASALPGSVAARFAHVPYVKSGTCIPAGTAAAVAPTPPTPMPALVPAPAPARAQTTTATPTNTSAPAPARTPARSSPVWVPLQLDTPAFTISSNLESIDSVNFDAVKAAFSGKLLLTQELPYDADMADAVLAPLRMAWHIAGETVDAVNTTKGMRGVKAWFGGQMYIMGRLAGTEARPDAEVVQRANRFAQAAAEGRVGALLTEFVADIARPCEADGGEVGTGGAGATPLPVSQVQWWASHNEWGKAWQAVSKTGRGKDPAVLRRLTPQKDDAHPLPSDTVTRNVPGVAPIKIDFATFKKRVESLPIRAAGPLASTNAMLKAVARDELTLKSMWRVGNGMATGDVHPEARSLIVDVQACCIDKVDEDGVKCGERPLGMGECERRLFLGAVMAQKREWCANFFTNPLPEDAKGREDEMAVAASRHLQAQMEYQAASQTLSPEQLAPYAARQTAAEIDLRLASRPVKFVRNYCFSPHGCETMFRTVEARMFSAPRDHVLSDDMANMYNEGNREGAFDFLRRRCPDLVPLARLFYGDDATRVWFEGGLVHASEGGMEEDGPVTDANCLRVCRGGVQGCPLATLMAVGRYHECLSDIQRAHPDVDIECMADDTVMSGPPESLYRAFDAKQMHVLRVCWLRSNITKVKCYSPCGDMRLAPATIKGSRCHSDGVLAGLKIVGAFLSADDAWAGQQLVKALRLKLKPLDTVDAMRDTERVRHTGVLRRNLITRVANSIPVYWMRIMRPEVTELAAVAAVARIDASTRSLYHVDESPGERVDMAMAQAHAATTCAGLGLYDFVAVRHAMYAACSYAVHPAVERAVPAVAGLDLTADPATLHPVSPAHAAFAAAYAMVVDDHASVVATYKARDALPYYYVTGDKRSHFRPKYPTTRALPCLGALYADRTAGTVLHPSQKALVMAVQHKAFLGLQARVAAFDASNPGAEVRDREARRLVSAAQPLAGTWLTVTPDASLPHTRPRTKADRVAMQRRLGLYLTDARPQCDAMAARGTEVTQGHRLGDAQLNKASKTARHNRFNKAWYDAVRATATTTVILGDKGDGSPRARAHALQRYGWANNTHVADIIEKDAARNGNHVLYESKLCSPLRKTDNLGTGTSAGGATPSTAAGNVVAFGCTEEAMLHLIRGCKARGGPADGHRFDRSTGAGHVREHAGHYHDALTNKLNEVVELIGEVFGGVTQRTHGVLTRLKARAKVRDGTVYGAHSTRCYYQHHAGAISLAIVMGTSDTLVEALSVAVRPTSPARSRVQAA